MLAHGGARKFIILGMPFISFLLVDQLQDRDLREACELLSQPALVVRQPVIGDFPQRGMKAGLPRMNPSIDVGVVARGRGYIAAGYWRRSLRPRNDRFRF